MNLFFKKKKEIILCVHGFGKRTSSEMDPLKSFLEAKGYETITFDIYNPQDPEDCDYKQWIERSEVAMKKVLAKKRPVILLGFSMGGVIASYLASIYPVERLILVAPAFWYINLSQSRNAAKGLLTSSGSSMPRSMSHAFTNIVDQYRQSISYINCPVLLLHGTDDEVIMPSSSKKAFELIPHNKKRLLYVEGGKHRMLYDGQQEKTVHTLVLNMIKDELF